MGMTWPPQSVKTKATSSAFNARATSLPPCNTPIRALRSVAISAIGSDYTFTVFRPQERPGNGPASDRTIIECGGLPPLFAPELAPARAPRRPQPKRRQAAALQDPYGTDSN